MIIQEPNGDIEESTRKKRIRKNIKTVVPLLLLLLLLIPIGVYFSEGNLQTCISLLDISYFKSACINYNA